jgi:hypothetical protein
VTVLGEWGAEGTVPAGASREGEEKWEEGVASAWVTETERGGESRRVRREAVIVEEEVSGRRKRIE